MKTILCLTFFLLPHFIFAQAPAKKKDAPRNTFMVTPFNGLINDATLSIYYKPLIQRDSVKSQYVRIGTEALRAFKLETSPGVDASFRAFNFKLGIETERKTGKRASIYYGPEISFSYFIADDVLLRPAAGILFFDNALIANELVGVEESRMILFSLMAFAGFKYKLTKSFSVGVETALGVGFFNTDIKLAGRADETEKGNIFDFAASRFIFIEYRF
ncbi:MAG: hypothetical protein AAF990_27040 [Bacteroidota bacterium]